MKTRFVLIIIGVFVFSFIFVSVSSQNVKEFELEKGKNTLIFNNTEEFYVKSLFDLNEDIEVVSYNVVNRDVNKSIGYIKAFGGVGKNFIVEPNKEYEVIVSENTTVTLPQ